MASSSVSHVPRLKYARAIVFFSSFCLMTLELIASRILAPHIGASLYTWTSVIATILLGVTAGNYAGGRLADRSLSRTLLGGCLLLGGVAALAILAVAGWLGPLVSQLSWPIWMITLIFCVAVFFPTAFFLSMISPQVVKFDLRDLEKTGTTVGAIGVWSSIGSIVGTFVSGYVFILYVGTRFLVSALGIALLAVGIGIIVGERVFGRRSTHHSTPSSV